MKRASKRVPSGHTAVLYRSSQAGARGRLRSRGTLTGTLMYSRRNKTARGQNQETKTCVVHHHLAQREQVQLRAHNRLRSTICQSLGELKYGPRGARLDTQGLLAAGEHRSRQVVRPDPAAARGRGGRRYPPTLRVRPREPEAMHFRRSRRQFHRGCYPPTQDR